jgi:GT2 family glycosyltransferase
MENPQTDIFYYDCEYSEKSTKRWMPLFKPTEIPKAIFLSTNILSRSLINLAKLKEIWPLLELDRDFEAIEYEIYINLYETGVITRHIPALLVKQESLVTSQSPSNSDVIIQYLSQEGLQDISCDNRYSPPRFTWKRGDPSVAVIIPTKDNQRYLKSLLNSIVSTKGKTDLSITLVDNNSHDSRTLEYYSELETNKTANIIHYDQCFNYSEAINLGVSNTESDLIVLMNDDMLVKDEKWLEEVTQWAIRPEVGVVGGKLLRANHTIQHAGVVLGLMGLAGHLYLNAPEHYNGLLGSVDWYRNYLAVTGAFQAMRRDVFNEVGGYHLDYQLAFGDIDFCLRVHEAGYQIVYTPYAQLYHYQGKSRGYNTPIPDLLRGFEDFREFVINGDPYFSSSLTYTTVPECILGDFSREEKIHQLQDRIRFYTKDH